MKIGAGTHPSHDWHPDDDVVSCDGCGCRTYNAIAKVQCAAASTEIVDWVTDRFVCSFKGAFAGAMFCTTCGRDQLAHQGGTK